MPSGNNSDNERFYTLEYFWKRLVVWLIFRGINTRSESLNFNLHFYIIVHNQALVYTVVDLRRLSCVLKR